MASHEFSSSKRWNYDVFLSFRGEDTRNGFTGHLHWALKNESYNVFIDDGLKRGEQIRKGLFQAIEESRISIIVFSKRYADSSWCLDELEKIMDCRDKLGQTVLPIFYDVDPSHVRKQKGCLAQAFQEHEDDIREEKDDEEREAKEERIKQWRKALTQAADLSGHHLKNRHEAKLIKEIVDELRGLLPSTDELHVADHPVGIDSRVQPIINDLRNGESNDIKMVGIWGMGGLGKTTVAKAIYNKIRHSFQHKCFLGDVSDTERRFGLIYLQKLLVFDKFQINSVDVGNTIIKRYLRRKSVLLVIDNVDKVEQVNAIAGNCDCFGPRSIIIITTRDEHLLDQLRVNMGFPARKMNEEEALELFSCHAFHNSFPNEEYLELSMEVVSYCGGLPLALKVLGSSLTGRPIIMWKSHLEKLKRIPEDEIIQKLKISYDGLGDDEREMFLDISCFFLGMDENYVTKILDGCDFFAIIGIQVLRERCLVDVEYGQLRMHDLIREMGKIIVCKASPTQPGRWRRLWDAEVVTNVLTNKSGTEEIKGIALDLPSSKKASFNTKAFANMKNLRLLKLNNVELTGNFKHFPKELRWLRWHGFPFKSMPKHLLRQPKLVALDLQRSELRRGWKNSKPLENLTILDLKYSRKLKESPDFSRLPNLKELDFGSCYSLSKIHPSIGQLNRLTLVNFIYCHKLRRLPGEFCKLKSVEKLVLNGTSLRELPEGLGGMVSLRKLEAHDTTLTQIPSSIIRLENLTKVYLSRNTISAKNPVPAGDAHFKNLGSLIAVQDLRLRGYRCCNLPSLRGLSNLVNLWLDHSPNLRAIPDLPTSLKTLTASGCLALETMPDFSEMSNMRELLLSDSPKVTEVPGLGSGKSLNSMERLYMGGCTNLTAEFRKNILQGWISCGAGGIYLNGIYHIPEWFEFVADGNKVSFDVPQCDGRNFKGLTLCCLYLGNGGYHNPLDITIENRTKQTTLRASWDVYTGGPCFEDYFWQGQLSNDKLNLLGGDKIVILLKAFGMSAKKTGVNLVWDKPLKESMPHCRYTSEPEPESESESESGLVV